MTDVNERIQKLISDHPVFLFMKGVPAAPQCGFSAAVVQVLNNLGTEFGSADVLADGEIREGVKRFSSWPTLPQLFVRGEFIGGCDIVVEMAKSGELEALLARNDVAV